MLTRVLGRHVEPQSFEPCSQQRRSGDEKERREKAHYLDAVEAVSENLKARNQDITDRLEVLLQKERDNILRKHRQATGEGH
jgi:hypothetical protein